MWRISALTKGGLRRDVPFLAVDEDFSPTLAYRLATEIARRAGVGWPAGLLESEISQRPTPGTSSISLWNGQVDNRTFSYSDAGRPTAARLEPLGDSIALRRGDERLAFAARHDRTTLVFPVEEGVDSITLEYQSSLDDTLQWRSLSRAVRGIELSWVESRFYVGTRSAVLLGLLPLRTRTPIPTGWEQAKVKAGTVTGMCAATVLRTCGDWANKLNTDPMFLNRLNYAENAHGHRRWPALEEFRLQKSRRMWVLVHGTLSSCYQAFEDLPQDVFGDDPVYRFEHDTCAEIESNAKQLCDLLADVPYTVEIRLLAHSRGGLVARSAGDRLMDSRAPLPRNVRVLTFGTPHRGTPLVNQMQGLLGLRLLNGLFGLIAPLMPGVALSKAFGWLAPVAGQHVLSLLARLGTGNRVSNARYDATLVATAYALLRAGRLPAGIDDMRPSSSYLDLLARTKPAWPGCAAWAGVFDVDHDPDGFGLAFEQALSRGMFNDKENDLVVPTESALAFGSPTLVPGCSHTAYFGRTDIQAALKSL